MKDKLPEGYDSPTALPDQLQRDAWQTENRAWWEAHPMRYDWKQDLAADEFSLEFFEEINERFFSDAARYMPPRQYPFDTIIPFDQLSRSAVLEIGVGSGSHAQLLSPHCGSYAGIDLTDYAIRSTAARLRLLGLPGNVLQMDAERLAFANGTFDFIWTWGVIHHSADTAGVLREMHRVMRPGAIAVVMVYHRSALYSYGYAALLRGVVRGGFRRHSLHELLQLNTDGALARFYQPREWRELTTSCGFVIEQEWVMGQKSEVILLPAGRVKDVMTNLIPDAWTRFITNTCRQGSFLITRLRKA